MSYLVFARKYRPQKFSEVTGQDHVTLALSNAVTRDRVPHALLFSGPRGVGKTSCARILAKILNCASISLVNEEPVPCGECGSCQEIAKGNNLAVIEIDGASNNSVEDVRELIETLYTATPPGIKFKIYIIDEVHMLSTAAFNALLKSIEEPPKNTLFILATTETHKIPDTVKSRCQEHTFRKLRSEHIVSQLTYICQKEGIKISQEVLRLVSRVADGGMRDASSLLDRVCSFTDEELKSSDLALLFGTLDASYFLNLIDLVLNANEDEALHQVENAFNQGIEVKAFLSDFLLYFRLVFLYSLASRRGAQAVNRFFELKDLSDVEQSAIRKITENRSAETFSILFEIARLVCDTAIKSEYAQYVIESGIIKLCYANKLTSLPLAIMPVSTVTLASAPNSEITSSSNYTEEQKKKPIAENYKEVYQQDLSWTSFMGHLKKSSEVLLTTYLTRVAPSTFIVKDRTGVLKLKGTSFVIDSIKEKQAFTNLKKQLTVFSHVDNWNVDFIIENHIEKITVSDTGSNTLSAINKNGHIKGSQAHTTEQKRKERIEKIESEAKDGEAVKIVLEVFEGSAIEKIIPEVVSADSTNKRDS